MSDFQESLKRLHVLKIAFEQQQHDSQRINQPDNLQLKDFLESEKNNINSEFGNSAIEIHNNIILLYKELAWI